jgi:hypothetical protein
LTADQAAFAAFQTGLEKECCGVKKTLDGLMIQKALDESRIRVIAVKDKEARSKIAEQARVLGIDDKNGVNA